LPWLQTATSNFRLFATIENYTAACLFLVQAQCRAGTAHFPHTSAMGRRDGTADERCCCIVRNPGKGKSSGYQHYTRYQGNGMRPKEKEQNTKMVFFWELSENFLGKKLYNSLK
jgi:hypothetical protein